MSRVRWLEPLAFQAHALAHSGRDFDLGKKAGVCGKWDGLAIPGNVNRGAPGRQFRSARHPCLSS